jgi:hypothetical protein
VLPLAWENEANARGLVRGVLKATRGHPALLQIAEGLVEDLRELARPVLTGKANPVTTRRLA